MELRWYKIESKGTVPSPRHFHATAAIGDRVYMFGGFDGEGWKDDTHVLDLGASLRLWAPDRVTNPGARAYPLPLRPAPPRIATQPPWLGTWWT